ncbi:hypothetical protein [Cedecea davisae]|uniref:hypothetical protein n=1 Tax=Cedecea davisae TaxID=158484 RepID=UPI00242BC88A|nr:hypothetical protein [Cedecea davisae]
MMRAQVQSRILALVGKNPGYQITDVIHTLTDVDRSSISSALTRLTMQGKLIRETGKNRRFIYFVPKGDPVPCELEKRQKLAPEPDDELAPLDLPPPAIKQVGMAEWERRFAAAGELDSKGLHRRAARLLLELLDVTADQSLRERIIRRKAGTGRWL